MPDETKKTTGPRGTKRTAVEGPDVRDFDRDSAHDVPDGAEEDIEAADEREAHKMYFEPKQPNAPGKGGNIPANGEPGEIYGTVRDAGGAHELIRNAHIVARGPVTYDFMSDENGNFKHIVKLGMYQVHAIALGVGGPERPVNVTRPDCPERVDVQVPLGFQLKVQVTGEDCVKRECDQVRAGAPLALSVAHDVKPDVFRNNPFKLEWSASHGTPIGHGTDPMAPEAHFDTATLMGPVDLSARVVGPSGETILLKQSALVNAQPVQPVSGDLSVGLRRTATIVTNDLPLWLIIRRSTDALSFKNYDAFMNVVLCNLDPRESGLFDTYELSRIAAKRDMFTRLQTRRYLPFTDSDAYRLLKVATEAFVMVNCGVAFSNYDFLTVDDYVTDMAQKVSLGGDLRTAMTRLWNKFLVNVNGSKSLTLPYLAIIARKFPELRLKSNIFAYITDSSAGDFEPCYGLIGSKLTQPCLLELIWSYWHEEAMLVQTLNAITRRFQNVRVANGNDPLANMEIDPLRPLNNLLWGYIQDEQHRLTVIRRAYEYDHHYGLRLQGRAVPSMSTADSRSQFLQAFHNLLHTCSIFFQQDDDTTVISDGFPVLNALKEVHLILSQGAHNQFGDLPSTARIEMLMQEWLLARPEFREFLPTRIMVAYPEPWMDRVDAMKKLQGWSDVNVLHFRDLGIFGEQLLLSIRYGAWVDSNEPDQARNWARYWRAEIQGYIHAYRAVTSVDIAAEPVNSVLPSVLLRQRLAQQQQRTRV